MSPRRRLITLKRLHVLGATLALAMAFVALPDTNADAGRLPRSTEAEPALSPSSVSPSLGLARIDANDTLQRLCRPPSLFGRQSGAISGASPAFTGDAADLRVATPAATPLRWTAWLRGPPRSSQ